MFPCNHVIPDFVYNKYNCVTIATRFWKQKPFVDLDVKKDTFFVVIFASVDRAILYGTNMWDIPENQPLKDLICSNRF